MDNVSNTLKPKKWISHLLTVSQLVERKNVDFKSVMQYLKVDLDTAISVQATEFTEIQCNTSRNALKYAQSRRTLKGEKLYAYYKISEYIRELKRTGIKALQVWKEVKKTLRTTSERAYTIALRVGQLIDSLELPYLRTFGFISPEVVYWMRKTEWDILCDYTIAIASPETLLEEIIEFTSQEFSV